LNDINGSKPIVLSLNYKHMCIN